MSYPFIKSPTCFNGSLDCNLLISATSFAVLLNISDDAFDAVLKLYTACVAAIIVPPYADITLLLALNDDSTSALCCFSALINAETPPSAAPIAAPTAAPSGPMNIPKLAPADASEEIAEALLPLGNMLVNACPPIITALEAPNFNMFPIFPPGINLPINGILLAILESLPPVVAPSIVPSSVPVTAAMASSCPAAVA